MGKTSFFWGLLLLPFTCATFYHFPGVLSSFHSGRSAAVSLLIGAAAYAVFEVFFSRPMRTYVFGHELTHALASMMMGGKVHSFHVSKKGGSVQVSKSNFFVALAPYCVPLYTLAAVLANFLLGLWLPVGHYRGAFLGAVGFTLAFHASLTLYAIRQSQPDIHKTGAFFSLVFILLTNAWALVLLNKMLVAQSFPLTAFFTEVFRTQTDIWSWTFSKGFELVRWGYGRIAAHPS